MTMTLLGPVDEARDNADDIVIRVRNTGCGTTFAITLPKK